MVLSKRERYIAIGTIGAVALLVLYFFFIDPKLDQKKDLGTKISAAQMKLDRGNQSLKLKESMSGVWKQRTDGPLTSNASEAEGQVLRSVETWAKEAGVTALSINKSDRADREKDFSKITVRATCVGGMAQLTKFLINIQTASIPVRVTDLQIATRKEGLDDLSIQIAISTICFVPETKPVPAPVAKPESL